MVSIKRPWAVVVRQMPRISDSGKRWLARGDPVDDAFADHDHRCVGST